MGNISPRVKKLKNKFLALNSKRANTKAANPHTKTTPPVVASIRTMLLNNIRQNVDVLNIPMRFSQWGGFGIAYGREYISPVVLRLPKTRITSGVKIITTM